MSYFEVDSIQLRHIAGEISGISEKLDLYSNQIISISKSLAITSYKEVVQQKLSSISTNVSISYWQVRKLEACLHEISSLYENTERIILGEADSNSIAVEEVSNIISKIALPSGESVIPLSKYVKGAVVGGLTREATVNGKLFGFLAHGKAKGEVLGGSSESKIASGFKWKEGKLDSLSLLDVKKSEEKYIAKGTASGGIGLLKGEISAELGKVKGEGSVSASLYKDGKLSPRLQVKGEAEATALEGELKGTVGTDDTNIHGKLKGKLGTAEAKGNIGIGKIYYKDKKGNEKIGWGVASEAKLEAYKATGEVSGGLTIMGVKVDAKVKGKLGGAGVGVGGHLTNSGVGGSFDLGVGAGGGIDVEIDWSGFKVPKITPPKIKLPKMVYEKS